MAFSSDATECWLQGDVVSDELSKLRDAECRAINSVSGLVNSLMLAEYFVLSPLAYTKFIQDIALKKTDALNAIEGISNDIYALQAILLVLSSLQARVSEDSSQLTGALN